MDTNTSVEEAVVYDLVVVGLGPSGIEATLEASKLGLKYISIESEKIGSTFTNGMLEKKFLHDYGTNKAGKMLGLLSFADRSTGRELVLGWKEQLSKSNVTENTRLNKITKEGDIYNLGCSNCTLKSRSVLLTTGIFENPIHLHVDGELNNQNISYTLDYSKQPEGKRVLVVGGGNSAAETALTLFGMNEVSLIVREGEMATSVTERNRKDLMDAEKNGGIKIIYNTEVKEVKSDKVMANGTNGEQELAYDNIYIHIGFEKPDDWLLKMGIKTLDGKPVLDDNFETSLPNVFITGSLAGTNSIIDSANQTVAVIKKISESVLKL